MTSEPTAAELGAMIEAVIEDLAAAMASEERLLTRQQVAELLAVSVTHVRKLVESGHLRQVDVAVDAQRPAWRIRRTDVIAFIETLETERPPD